MAEEKQLWGNTLDEEEPAVVAPLAASLQESEADVAKVAEEMAKANVKSEAKDEEGAMDAHWHAHLSFGLKVSDSRVCDLQILFR